MKKFIEVTERGCGRRTLINCDYIIAVAETKEGHLANLWLNEDDNGDGPVFRASETFDNIHDRLYRNGLLCTRTGK